VPVETWLNGDLKDRAREILLDRKTKERGYFESSAIEALLAGTSRSGGNIQEIFSLITLELWHRQFIDISS